jgi:hypothetical protein
MAHAQKPDFVFWLNGRAHLNRRRASVQSNTDSRGVRISGSNARYTMFRGSVKSTGYPRHSSVSPSLPLPCVTVCCHISTGLYVLLSVCVCCLRYPACKPHALYYTVIYGLSGSAIYLNISHKGHAFRKISYRT